MVCPYPWSIGVRSFFVFCGSRGPCFSPSTSSTYGATKRSFLILVRSGPASISELGVKRCQTVKAFTYILSSGLFAFFAM